MSEDISFCQFYRFPLGFSLSLKLKGDKCCRVLKSKITWIRPHVALGNTENTANPSLQACVVLESQLLAHSLFQGLTVESWTVRADRDLISHLVSLSPFTDEAQEFGKGGCLFKVMEHWKPCHTFYLPFRWLQTMIRGFKEKIFSRPGLRNPNTSLKIVMFHPELYVLCNKLLWVN